MTTISRSRGGDRSNGGLDGLSVLVTGAAGFIGSHVCERILREGHSVWALDNFDDGYEPSLKRSNLAEALRRASVHLVEGDVRDEILLDGLMSDMSFDAVIHLAARSGVRASIEKPELCHEINVVGTLCLLESLRRHPGPALLLGSSTSVYGDGEETLATENEAADRPTSPYAASKRSAELLCHAYHRLHGLTVLCLRLATVYGPRQRPDQELRRVADLLATGESLSPDSERISRRDYLYIDDAVDGVLLALHRALRQNGAGPSFEIFNLGSGASPPPREIVGALARGLDMQVDVGRYIEPDDRHVTLASIDRAEKLLGFSPRVGPEEGIARLVEWLRETETTRDRSPAE